MSCKILSCYSNLVICICLSCWLYRHKIYNVYYYACILMRYINKRMKWMEQLTKGKWQEQLHTLFTFQHHHDFDSCLMTMIWYDHAASKQVNYIEWKKIYRECEMCVRSNWMRQVSCTFRSLHLFSTNFFL